MKLDYSSQFPSWFTPDNLDVLRQGNVINDDTYANSMSMWDGSTNTNIPYGTQLTQAQEVAPEINLPASLPTPEMPVQLTSDVQPSTLIEEVKPQIPEEQIIPTAKKAWEPSDNLMKAVIDVESKWDPNAVSVKNAVGLAQVTPIAYREIMNSRGTPTSLSDAEIVSELKKPGVSEQMGREYLTLLAKQNPEWSQNQLLAAYNGGPGRLKQLGGDISKMPKESVQYVDKVNAALAKLGEPPAQPTGAQAGKQPTAEPQAEKQPPSPFDVQKVNALAAATSIAELENQKAREVGDYQKLIVDLQTKQLEAETERKSLLAKWEKDIAETTKTYEGKSLDPRRFYKNASTMDTIISAIAIAAGGIASGMTGRPNVALEIINDAVKNDIEAQKAELEKGAGVIRSKQTFLNELRGRIGDERTAENAAMSAIYNNISLTVKNYAERTDNLKTKQALLTLASQAETEKQKFALEIQKQAENNPKVQAAREGQFIADSYLAKNRGLPEPSVAQLGDDSVKRFIPGIGFAASETRARDVAEALDAYNKGVANIDLINAEVNREGTPWLGRTFNQKYYAEMESMLASLENGVRVVGKMGALDAGAIAQARKQIPSIEELMSIRNAGAIAKLNTFKNDLTNYLISGIKSNVVTPFPGLEQQFLTRNEMQRLKSLTQPIK